MDQIVQIRRILNIEGFVKTMAFDDLVVESLTDRPLAGDHPHRISSDHTRRAQYEKNDGDTDEDRDHL